MISKDDVRYIASLSRIHVTEDQLDHFAEDLKKILHHINKLEKLDVSNVEPTSHVLSLENVYRDDVPDKPLTQEEALSVSKHNHKGFFQVPKVIDS